MRCCELGVPAGTRPPSTPRRSPSIAASKHGSFEELQLRRIAAWQLQGMAALRQDSFGEPGPDVAFVGSCRAPARRRRSPVDGAVGVGLMSLPGKVARQYAAVAIDWSRRPMQTPPRVARAAFGCTYRERARGCGVISGQGVRATRKPRQGELLKTDVPRRLDERHSYSPAAPPRYTRWVNPSASAGPWGSVVGDRV